MEKILIIEDEIPLLKMLCSMIERQGYEVITAADGDEGLQMCYKDRPGIIITDISLPKKQGTEIINEIKQYDPSAKIIAMTGYHESYLEKAKQLGANYVFTKPIERKDLIDAIKELLK